MVDREEFSSVWALTNGIDSINAIIKIVVFIFPPTGIRTISGVIYRMTGSIFLLDRHEPNPQPPQRLKIEVPG